MEPHNSGADCKTRGRRRRRRIEENLSKLAAAVGELPAQRAALLMEDLKMGMIDADLRTAIVGSGLTHYALAQRAGVAPEQIDRFISGERDVRLGTAAKVAAALGMELKRPGRSTRKKTPAAKRKAR